MKPLAVYDKMLNDLTGGLIMNRFFLLNASFLPYSSSLRNSFSPTMERRLYKASTSCYVWTVYEPCYSISHNTVSKAITIIPSASANLVLFASTPRVPIAEWRTFWLVKFRIRNEYLYILETFESKSELRAAIFYPSGIRSVVK